MKVKEQRQYKSDSIQSKIIPVLKLARFFPHCIGCEKERQFQRWNYFWLNGIMEYKALLTYEFCFGKKFSSYHQMALVQNTTMIIVSPVDIEFLETKEAKVLTI